MYMPKTVDLPITPSGSTNPDLYKAKSAKNNNRYVVEGYEYPSDLTAKSSQYGGNYVTFYINVNEDSKMTKNKDQFLDAGTQASVDNERIKKEMAGKEYTQTGLAAAFGTLGGVATGAVGQLFGSGFSSALKSVGIGAAVGAGSVAAVASQTQASTFSRPQKRLKTAIALYVPNDLSVRYGAGWGDEETFNIQAVLDAGREIAAATDGLKKSAGNVAGIAAAFALKNTPGAAALSAATGLSPNPKKEQIFQGVDFRTFTFNYQFAPRDATEAENVMNIINLFKYHMHPEYKDDNGFLFVYPSEFDIVYYHGGAENLKLHRHTSCVLTELNVNYTPNGVLTTFADGMPTQINVQMTFKELNILTKELIEKGL